MILIDKYKCSRYGIGSDRKGTFSVGNGFGRNCIIFGVDTSYATHVHNKKKGILILGEGPTLGLDGTKLTSEKMYSVKFTENKKTFCLSFHYNGTNSYLFVYGTKLQKFKEKDSQIVATPLCLENVSKEFSVDNTKKNKIKWICL